VRRFSGGYCADDTAEPRPRTSGFRYKFGCMPKIKLFAEAGGIENLKVCHY